jgi:hypothetical protein
MYTKELMGKARSEQPRRESGKLLAPNRTADVGF